MGVESYKQPEEKIPEELMETKRIVDAFYEKEKGYDVHTAKSVTPVIDGFKESFSDETSMLKRVEEISRIYKEKISEEQEKSPKRPEEYWGNMSMKYLFNKILTEEEKNNFKKFQELDIERREKLQGKEMKIIIKPNLDYSLCMLINNIPLSTVKTEKDTKEKIDPEAELVLKTPEERQKEIEKVFSEKEKKEKEIEEESLQEILKKDEDIEKDKPVENSGDLKTSIELALEKSNEILKQKDEKIGVSKYGVSEKEKKEKEIEKKEAEESDKETIEKEKSPEEVLNEKRQELAKEYAGLKEKKLGIFGSEQIEDKEKAEKVAYIENEYKNSLKNYRKDLLEKEPEKAQEILLKTVFEEANKLYDLKTDLKLEAKGDSKIEKIKKITGKAVEKYRKLPLRYKLLLSAGLLGGGVAAGAIGGATGAALATGMVTGRWFQRAFGGAAAAVGLEGLIKRSQEKKEKKEVLKKFGDDIKKTLEKDSVKLDKKLLELEAGKKGKKRRRYILAGTVGGLIFSGAVGKAFAGVFGGFGDEAAEKIEPEAVDTEPAPTTEELPEVLEAPISEGEPAVVAAETAPAIEGVVEVSKGDSIWKLTEKQLEDRGYFNRLEGTPEEIEAKKTYFIDAIKNKISADPEKFGISSGDADILKAGDKIDFNSIFESSEAKSELGHFIEKAQGLSQEDINNILKNNEAISEWAKEHPGEALTTEKVEEILHPKPSIEEAGEKISKAGVEEVVKEGEPEVEVRIEVPIEPGAEPHPEIVIGSELAPEALTLRISEDFGVGAETYNKFSSFDTESFITLDSKSGESILGPPWEGYNYDKISRLQWKMKEFYIAELSSAEKEIAAKLTVNDFVKKYFDKLFSK